MKQNTASDVTGCTESGGAWNKLWADATTLASEVPANRRDFYQASVLTMIAISRESNAMRIEVAEARQLLGTGKKAATLEHLDAARAALPRSKAEEARAEYGKWEHWYSGDCLTDVDRTIELVEMITRWIKDPHAPIPLGAVWNG